MDGLWCLFDQHSTKISPCSSTRPELPGITLVWLELNHSCPRACRGAAVVVLPSRALLEVQPLLIDLAAAAAAGAMSGSSSSSGEDEESDAGQQCGVPADNSAAAAVPELLQQGVAVGMSQPSDSNWCRVLLQLQHAGSSSTHEVESHAKQAAAAGKWLAAYCSPVCGDGGQPGQPGTQVASLRCWYDGTLQDGAHSDGGWANLLLSELPSEVAGQLVPVLSAECFSAKLGRCWCLIELLVWK
jgi:hypothetical protein